MSRIETAAGTIWAVFGHRLAIESETGRVLADLGPKGAEGLALTIGDRISVEGERRPGEIKVSLLSLDGGEPRRIDWPAKAGPDHGPGDPATALRIAQEAGYRVEGTPTRKPRHVEIRGVKDGAAFEIHVRGDGTIYKVKPFAAA